MVSITKIRHRGEYRIKIASKLSPLDKQKVLQITGRRWSQSLVSWHLPYSTEAYHELIEKVGKENITLLPSDFDNHIVEKIAAKNEAFSKKSVIRKPQWAFYTKKNNQQEKVVTGNCVIVDQLSPHLISAYVPTYHPSWLDIIRTIEGRKWNPEEKYWTFPYTQESIDQLKQIASIHFNFELNDINLRPKTVLSKKNTSKSKKSRPYDTLNQMQQLAVTKLEEMLILERKSHNTIKAYRTHIINLFRFYPVIKPSKITNKQLKAYLVHKIKVDKIQPTTQGQILNALVAFYKRLLKQEGHLTDLIRPKKKQSLPNVFSKEEIKKLFNTVTNLKHKTLLMLVYSAGLRRSEVRNLRKKDILFSRNCIFIKDSKGQKDRYVLLSNKVIQYLKPYLKEYKPKYWLFEGTKAGQYGETSIQNIFTNGKIQAGINPSVTFHGLRHSFATHSIENGVPLHVVKDLLGHHSLKTTEVYLHISDKFRKKFRSPLDDLDL